MASWQAGKLANRVGLLPTWPLPLAACRLPLATRLPAAQLTWRILTHAVKVRLQSQPTDRPLTFTGPLDCFKQTVKQEGIRGLYRVSRKPVKQGLTRRASRHRLSARRWRMRRSSSSTTGVRRRSCRFVRPRSVRTRSACPSWRCRALVPVPSLRLSCELQAGLFPMILHFLVAPPDAQHAH